jgi:hypothetical protein
LKREKNKKLKLIIFLKKILQECKKILEGNKGFFLAQFFFPHSHSVSSLWVRRPVKEERSNGQILCICNTD